MFMNSTAKRFFLWTAVFVVLMIVNQCLASSAGAALAATGEVGRELDWQGWLTVAIFVLVFIALIWELLPPDVVMVIGAGVLVIIGIISPQEFLLGFSRDIIFILAMLFIVAHAMETCGILSMLARYALPKKCDGWQVYAIITTPVAILSGFLNNTPIILMMTPMVRKWALDLKRSPSKFLIPLSYASILGGVCTLIGTSTNLIVNDLIKNVHPAAELGFFEIGKVGLPCAIAGLIYLCGVGRLLVPERKDPAVALAQTTREFTGEFLVREGSVLVGQTVRDAGRQHFSGENLIEIERGSVVLDSPNPDEVIRANDRLVFAGDIKHIAELHAIPGLQSLADKHFKLDLSSSHFSEVVISATSTLTGKTLKRVNFRGTYGASVIAIYRQGKRVTGNVGDTVLYAGDTLMLLSAEPWHSGDGYMTDFYYIRHNEKIPIYQVPNVIRVVTVVLAMIGSVIMGVPMVLASLVAAIVLLVTRSVNILESRKAIQWSVLVLIGSSFAFGTGLVTTGVADYLADRILWILGSHENLMIAGLFVITMMATEVITNNAAALLIFPVAIQVGLHAGFDSLTAIKAIGVTVAVAASSSFLTPIGYQTNTIVYGPGGYRFTDYSRVGLPLSLTIFAICTYAIPKIWPMST